ncbi:hypothetical protein MUK42_22921 [Musa troglodytarum]|uniref:Uncharacterized protein n=1 Tax=Musa troglodytarum TaxID=320322 RepID=A0A9E7ESZ7_9LILI|nr:hypothetical protein MUK42_22921 [Musa troglodytarum]
MGPRECGAADGSTAFVKDIAIIVSVVVVKTTSLWAKGFTGIAQDQQSLKRGRREEGGSQGVESAGDGPGEGRSGGRPRGRGAPTQA